MQRIVGLAGKAGSGKSYLGEYLSRETGVKFIKLDYQVGQIANLPIIKQRLQRKIKREIPQAYEDMQLFPLWENLEKSFTAFEYWLIMKLLNRKVKKLIKSTKEPLIIDFFALPALKISRKFNKMYFIKCDEKMRIERLIERSGLDEKIVRKVDGFMQQYYGIYDGCKFDGIIENNYQNIPNEIIELATQIKQYS